MNKEAQAIVMRGYIDELKKVAMVTKGLTVDPRKQKIPAWLKQTKKPQKVSTKVAAEGVPAVPAVPGTSTSPDKSLGKNPTGQVAKAIPKVVATSKGIEPVKPVTPGRVVKAEHSMTISESRLSEILLQKTSQHLENVKTLPKLTDRELTRAIRDAIVAEQLAINQYETVADSTENAEAKKVLQDIANEERVHVGELQSLLKKILPDEGALLEEGAEEVNETEESED